MIHKSWNPITFLISSWTLDISPSQNRLTPTTPLKMPKTPCTAATISPLPGCPDKELRVQLGMIPYVSPFLELLGPDLRIVLARGRGVSIQPVPKGSHYVAQAGWTLLDRERPGISTQVPNSPKTQKHIC